MENGNSILFSIYIFNKVKKICTYTVRYYMFLRFYYKVIYIILVFSLLLIQSDRILAINNVHQKSKLYTRIEKFKVDYFVNDFLHRQNINDCFSFEENNILQLKCLRNNKLTNVIVKIESEENDEFSETIVV